MKTNKKGRTMKNFYFAILLLMATYVSACGEGSSPVVGTWQASSGSAIEITSDGKWIGHMGPMQLNLMYTVDGTVGKSIRVLLKEPGKPQDKGTPLDLTVAGDILTISGNEMWNGSWTKKK